MKKIKPKITSIVMLLMTLLITGGVAVQEVFGDPSIEPDDPDGGLP